MTRQKSKIKGLSILSCCVAMALMGCGDSMVTQDEIVTPKETEALEISTSTDGNTQNTLTTSIQEQVQVPEHYTCEITEGNITVKADADFVIPDAEGFKSYKVTPRIFVQEDYDTISRVLLDSAPLWTRDEEAMAESNGFIKSELEERIAKLKEEKASGVIKYLNDEPMDYDALIAEFEELKKNAPEEPIICDVPAIVPDSETVGNNPKEEKGCLYASATVQDEDYEVYIDNVLAPYWNAAQFHVNVNSERGVGHSYDYMKFSDIDLPLAIDVITKNAQQIITEMGFEDFEPAIGEYCQKLTYSDGELAEIMYGEPRYAIPFERTIEGIPITYTHDQGLTVDNDEACWPQEAFILVFDDIGFTDFQWISPYTVEKVSDDTVFLLPFSEIQNVLEEMMVKVKAEEYAETDIKVTYKINEIRLGYMRVHEKGDVSEGTLVPVWDFFGSESLQYPDDDSVYSNEGISYESQFTINAMDGTVINRGLGY